MPWLVRTAHSSALLSKSPLLMEPCQKVFKVNKAKIELIFDSSVLFPQMMNNRNGIVCSSTRDKTNLNFVNVNFLENGGVQNICLHFHSLISELDRPILSFFLHYSSFPPHKRVLCFIRSFNIK